MRAKFLLFAVLALLPGACSGTGSDNRAPPPIDRELLAGKWKSNSESQIVAGYEFGADGALKVTIRGMEQPVVGRYAWNGERTLGLEYEVTADVQQAYEAAAKAYKDDVADRIKAGKLPDRAGPSMLAAVRDKWPAGETFQVAISEKPRLLMLTREGEGTQTFEKTD
jgi:hypothetical protein